MKKVIFKYIIFTVTFLVFINIFLNDAIFLIKLSNLSSNLSNNKISTVSGKNCDLYAKIKNIRIKDTDNTYINVLFTKLKVIKVVKVLDKFSEDDKEQYILLVEPVKKK